MLKPLFIGMTVGTTLAVLITLFQSPVYQSTGRLFVESKNWSDVSNTVELAQSTGVRSRVLERMTKQRSSTNSAEIPMLKIQPIEKTTIIIFEGTSDNPSVCYLGVNDTMEEVVVSTKEKGIKTSIIDRAVSPTMPISPKRAVYPFWGAGIGSLLGLLLGLLRRR